MKINGLANLLGVKHLHHKLIFSIGVTIYLFCFWVLIVESYIDTNAKKKKT